MWHTHQTRIQGFAQVDYKQSQCKDANRRKLKPGSAIATKTRAIDLKPIESYVENIQIKKKIFSNFTNLFQKCYSF